jgi:hypothetical protein
MFHKSHFIFRLIGALIMIGLLVGLGGLAFQAGQTQGYAMGLLASGKEITAPPAQPVYPGMLYHTPFMPPFMPFLGMTFCAGFLFLLGLGFMGGLARLAFGHRGMGPWQGHPHHPGAHPWGPPPWAQQPPAAAPTQPETKTSEPNPQ